MLPLKPVAVALLTTTAMVLAAVSVQTAAQRQAESTVSRLTAANPRLSIGAVETSLLGGHVTLRNLRTTIGGTRISIGTLNLPLSTHLPQLIGPAMASPFDDEPAKPEAAPGAAAAPPTPVAPLPAAPPQAAPIPSAPASAGKASADNVVIASGTTTYRIKHIELGGTALTDADVKAILDPAASTGLVDRLKRVTAASIVVPEIAADSVAPDAESHWTERDILLVNVVAGRVATGSAAGTSIATKNAKQVINGTIGAVQVSGLDLAQIVRVFTERRTDDAEPLVSLADTLAIDGAHFSNLTQKSETSIGPIKETGFKGRPLKASTTAAAPADAEQTRATTNDVFHSFELSSFDARDVNVESQDNQGRRALKSLTMTDVGAGKIGGLTASGLAFSAPETALAVGTIVIKALDMPSTDGKSPAKDAKDVPLPGLGRTDISDIFFDTVSKASKPTEAPTHVKFGLKHIGFSADAAAADAPRHGAMAFENLTFELQPGSGAQPLIDMGYSRADISGGLQTTYDKAAQAATVKDLTLSGDGMGAIHVNLDLANVSPALFSQDQNASKVAALAVLIKSFDLTVDNAGLVDKALAWRAKADNLTQAQEQTQIAEVAATQIPAALGNGAASKTIAAAVAKFIAKPKTLRISAASKTGLGLADMALLSTPDVLLDTLDVRASADE